MISWPVSSPITIIHVDLWTPGKYIDSKGNMELMNAMYDMSQFVVVVPIPDESFATLADYLFQHVLMKFGLCHFVVLDDGTTFKGPFVAMCKVLDRNYDIILIEDRREAGDGQVNNNRNIVELIVGDIVMTRTTIQSVISLTKVAKLSYQIPDSFYIVQYTGRGSYLVRKLYNPNSPEVKFMAMDLYFFLPSLKLCEPVGSFNIIYLNYSYYPIINLLSKSLKLNFTMKHGLITHLECLS